MTASATSMYVSCVRIKAALEDASAMLKDDRAARKASSARSRTLAISGAVCRLRGERERVTKRPRGSISIASALPLGPAPVASVDDGAEEPSGVSDAGSPAIPAAEPPVHQEMLHLRGSLRTEGRWPRRPDGRSSLCTTRCCTGNDACAGPGFRDC
jgi:hypothetical protein